MIQFGDSGLVAKWDDFVLNNPGGTLWHSSSFLKCISNSFGYSLKLLYVEKEGEMVALLPLFSVPGLFGISNKLIGVPVSSWCGIICNSDEHESDLLKEARNWGNDLGAEYIEYRQIKKLRTNQSVKSTYVTFIFDLGEGSEVLWESMNRKTRGAIRKARKSELEVNVNNGSLDDFYNIYARRLHDLGSPAYSMDFFESLKREFGDDALITTVSKGGVIISACFSIKYKDTLYALLAGVNKRYLSLNPYSLMYWKLIEFACKEGLAKFDFGRSRIGTGSYDFKKNWGFPSTSLYYHYDLLKVAKIPALEAGSMSTKLFQFTWKMMPYPLVKKLGPGLRKYIVA